MVGAQDSQHGDDRVAAVDSLASCHRLELEHRASPESRIFGSSLQTIVRRSMSPTVTKLLPGRQQQTRLSGMSGVSLLPKMRGPHQSASVNIWHNRSPPIGREQLSMEIIGLPVERTTLRLASLVQLSRRRRIKTGASSPGRDDAGNVDELRLAGTADRRAKGVKRRCWKGSAGISAVKMAREGQQTRCSGLTKGRRLR